MKALITIFIFLSSTAVCSQTTQIVSFLSQPLSESSGLINLNGQLITHNDSGGGTALFEIDTALGAFSRKVFVENASNIDWEDIAVDDTYIYIGDFGNNQGDRTDLKIYRVMIDNYSDALNDTVNAEVISFSYNDQIDFTTTQFSTNFDAEAMIAFNDTLYIFTKNWGDQKSNIYAIPNQLGNHSAVKIDSLDPQGLLTGATYDTISNSLLLIGYQTNAFTYYAANIIPPYFSAETFTKTTLTVQNSFQVEGVASVGANYYMSAEQNPLGTATLYRFNLISNVGIAEAFEHKVKVYPNPVQDILNVKTDDSDFEIFIYDAMGRLVLKSTKNKIDCSDLDRGVYLVQYRDSQKTESFSIGQIIIF